MNRLYVIEFASGVLKAGITTCFRTRSLTLARSFGRIVNAEVSHPVNGRGAESALLRRLCIIGVRRGQTESFDGVRFPVAAQLMRQVCARKLTAKGLPKVKRVADRKHGGAGEVWITESTRLVMIGGKLHAQHAKFNSPTPIDAKQLERWVLRQLRETVA